MEPERKTGRINARIPPATLERLDFVVRNTDNPVVVSRSTALLAAVDAWLPGQESHLEKLGILPKKARAQA